MSFNIIQIAEILKSPALKSKSSGYPASWHGKIPLKVRMAKEVKSDLPEFISHTKLIAKCGNEYPVWVNSHGAMSVIFEDGEKLGLKAYEFEIIEWHEK